MVVLAIKLHICFSVQTIVISAPFIAEHKEGIAFPVLPDL